MAKPKFPSINAVAKDLRRVNKIRGGIAEDDVEDFSIDVRLQVTDSGDWNVYYGASDYDQDHRGYWGAASVPGNGRPFRSVMVAKDLIEQAKDQYAMEAE